MTFKQEVIQLLVGSFIETFEGFKDSIRQAAAKGNDTCSIKLVGEISYDSAFWTALKASDLGELDYSYDSHTNLLTFRVFKN